MRIIILIAALALVSCSVNRQAQRKLHRAKKLILQAEALGATWSKDTVRVIRTITIPGAQVDTTVQFDNTFDLGTPTSANTPSQTFAISSGDQDTVRVDRKGIKIQTIVQWKTKRIEVHGECPPDTVQLSVPVAVNNTLECPPCVQRYTWWKIIGTCLVVLIIGIVIGKMLWK
jgi:hypothetical protein